MVGHSPLCVVSDPFRGCSLRRGMSTAYSVRPCGGGDVGTVACASGRCLSISPTQLLFSRMVRCFAEDSTWRARNTSRRLETGCNGHIREAVTTYVGHDARHPRRTPHHRRGGCNRHDTACGRWRIPNVTQWVEGSMVWRRVPLLLSGRVHSYTGNTQGRYNAHHRVTSPIFFVVFSSCSLNVSQMNTFFCIIPVSRTFRSRVSSK